MTLEILRLPYALSLVRHYEEAKANINMKGI
jgi:hypothetical protein